MPTDKARAYIPIDLRGKKKVEEAIMIAIDDDVENSVSLNLQTDTMAIDVIFDDAALEILLTRILNARAVLAYDRGLKKGSENAKKEDEPKPS